MESLRRPRMSSLEEYLEHERKAETKSEYYDGEILAMSGASFSHNVIVANLIAILLPVLRRRGCQVLPSDLRVMSGRRVFYPDVSAICGPPRFHDSREDIVLNPNLIIEVLSPSTEGYDRGRKFVSYQQIPTLQEYLLVHQDRATIEQYRRNSDSSWLYQRFDGNEVGLPVLDVELALSEVYVSVTLEESEED